MTTTWHPAHRLRLVRPTLHAPRSNPFRFVAPLVGCLALLAGLTAIGHSGFHAEHVFSPHDALAGVHYTPLLAGCVVGFGLALLVGSGLVRAARGGMPVVGDLALGLGTVVLTLSGGAALGLGIVILADAWPTHLQHWLSADHTGGVLAVVAGSAALFAAVTAPLSIRRAPATATSSVPDQPSEPTEPDRPAEHDGPVDSAVPAMDEAS